MARKQVVIIGAGFAGLYAAKTLMKSKDVEITLINKDNFHTFTPLLYQVATCALDPSSIAYPVRSIFRKKEHVHFMLGTVTHIDHDQRTVLVDTPYAERQVSYDYLIVAAGSVTNYFGQQSIERNSYGLKDLDESLELRHHILKLFERAAWATDASEKDALTTLVVVGGGPTGLETAGALYELYNHVLKSEYGDQKPKLRARVILLEAQDHVLAPYPKGLQKAATEQLESIGVEVWLNSMVAEVSPDSVTLKDGRMIKTYTLVWAAGVKGSPMAEMLGVELGRAGRLPVHETMEVIGREGAYAAGDIVHLINPRDDRPYPMLIPVAKQQGILAAKNILRELDGKAPQTFEYNDRGIMATIGRSRAVAWIFYTVRLTGFLAWLSWLFLHLVTLVGARNRMMVLLNWIFNYATYDRSVRLILQSEQGARERERQQAMRKPTVAQQNTETSETPHQEERIAV
jgi:NADH:ubiquinone reductase (H+-translocating)